MNALIVTIGDAIGVLTARYEGLTPRVLLGIKPAPFLCRQGVVQNPDQVGHLLVARRQARGLTNQGFSRRRCAAAIGALRLRAAGAKQQQPQRTGGQWNPGQCHA